MAGAAAWPGTICGARRPLQGFRGWRCGLPLLRVVRSAERGDWRVDSRARARGTNSPHAAPETDAGREADVRVTLEPEPARLLAAESRRIVFPSHAGAYALQLAA